MNVLEKHPKLVVAAALIISVLALAHLISKQGHPPDVVAAVDTIFDDLRRQAQAVTAHLPEGAEVVVLAYDGEVATSGDARFQRIYRALEKQGLSIRHVERMVYDEARGWKMITNGFPYREFVRVAGAHSDADAFLSLCGVPYFSKGDPRPDPDALPPLLVTRAVQRNKSLEGMLNRGLIGAAVVAREKILDSGDGSEDRFDRSFEVIIGDSR